MFDIPELCEPRPFTHEEENIIAELRELCKAYPSIRFQTDNFFLTKYLRYTDWNSRKAFEAMCRYYELKHDFPSYYASKDVSEYMDLFNLKSRILLDKLDRNGRVVLLCKLGNMSPGMLYTDSAIMDDIWVEVLLSEPRTQINGLSIVADCKGLNSAIFKWLIPKNCKMGAAKLESFPIKNWTIHLVNMGLILKTCIMIVKPFLKKSTIERIHMHYNDLDQLHKEVGRECLPTEYGGTAGPLNDSKSLKYILSREKFLMNNRQYGCSI